MLSIMAEYTFFISLEYSFWHSFCKRALNFLSLKLVVAHMNTSCAAPLFWSKYMKLAVFAQILKGDIIIYISHFYRKLYTYISKDDLHTL